MKQTPQEILDRAALARLGKLVGEEIRAGRSPWEWGHKPNSGLRKRAKAGGAYNRRWKARYAARYAAPADRWAGAAAWLFASPDDAAFALAPYDHHSMGAVYVMRTAGGRMLGTYDATREYAKSCRFRATHGYSSATVGHAALAAAVRARHAAHCPGVVIGGLVTWVRPVPRSNPDAIRRALWWHADSDGMWYSPVATVRAVRGYVVRDYHAATRAKAEEWLAAVRAKEELAARERAEAARERAERAERERMARERMEREERETREERRAVLRHAVGTFMDSLAAGNCEAGTRAFCARVGYGSDRGRRVTLRAVCHVARRRGVWETAGRYVLRIAQRIVPTATLEDLVAIS